MSHTFSLEVISLDGVIFKGNVVSVVLPSTSGEIAVYADHINMVSNLKSGDVVLTPESGAKKTIKITGGFLEILNNKANVLAYYAADVEAVSAEVIKAAVERAKKAKTESREKNKLLSAFAEYELKKNIAELRANIRRSKRGKI
jgi:F-type H+-transporting ATPase subunit epsilon